MCSPMPDAYVCEHGVRDDEYCPLCDNAQGIFDEETPT